MCKALFRYCDIYFHTHTNNTHMHMDTYLWKMGSVQCSLCGRHSETETKLFRLRLGDNGRLVSLFIHFGANIP